MKREEIKVCILRVGGTNCDRETKIAFEDLGVQAYVLHMNELVKTGKLDDYQILVFPGGFSYGDYVRAGAIWGKKVKAKLGLSLKRFSDEAKPILGICNGFQVLIEAGFLPGFKGVSEESEASLAVNASARYECRWVYLRYEGRGRCVFTSKLSSGSVLRMPVAHSEGRFLLHRRLKDKYLKLLEENDQVVFRYCDEDGKPAEGRYPYNPNGSLSDIAAICNPEGNVLGLMPHPERAYYGWQLPDWTDGGKPPRYGDGWFIFASVVEYVEKRF
ncbi:MAG: phosphoribosylformylglycinamidine synthase subunit PurQ [Candidatus Nezhaarchaeales archaeon]